MAWSTHPPTTVSACNASPAVFFVTVSFCVPCSFCGLERSQIRASVEMESTWNSLSGDLPFYHFRQLFAQKLLFSKIQARSSSNQRHIPKTLDPSENNVCCHPLAKTLPMVSLQLYNAIFFSALPQRREVCTNMNMYFQNVQSVWMQFGEPQGNTKHVLVICEIFFRQESGSKIMLEINSVSL